jgi:hypothetical protein
MSARIYIFAVIIILPSLIFLNLIFLSFAPIAIADEHTNIISSMDDKCFDCHRDTTPGISVTWELSVHGAMNVICAACHGSDVQNSHDGLAPVDSKRCGKCHKEELLAHQSGGHSYIKEPASFAGECMSCHRVISSCDSCHTRHSTEPDIPLKAEVCTSCHGVEVPFYNIFRSSAHGAVYAARGEPGCTSCHMNEGTHNVSIGLSSGEPADRFTKARGKMVEVCASCHTNSFASNALERADRINSEARALMERAREILNAGPIGMPHHARAAEAETPKEQLLGAIERAYRKTTIAAYHQSQGATQRAMEQLKGKLIRAASLVKRKNRITQLEKRLDNLAGKSSQASEQNISETIKNDLRALKDQLIKGEIDESKYSKHKDELLDRAGL